MKTRPCSGCGSPIRPGRSDIEGRAYCVASECQRERNRRRQKRFVAKKKAQGIDVYAPYRAKQEANRKARLANGAPTARQKYPDRYRDADLRRRARKAGATVENFTRAEIFDRDGWLCGICLMPVDPESRWPAPESPSLDHVIPLARGGAHSRANVQCSHLDCNVRKQARLVP